MIAPRASVDQVGQPATRLGEARQSVLTTRTGPRQYLGGIPQLFRGGSLTCNRCKKKVVVHIPKQCQAIVAMPFPTGIRQEVFVCSRRSCCVCHEFAGRDAVVHHIVPEASGGPNTIDNAILLCSRCHGEAGHYNPSHPLGTKYSPSELRGHRDAWWRYCETYEASRRPAGYREQPGSGHASSAHQRKVGVLWSHRADITADVEIIEFDGELLAEDRFENLVLVRRRELFRRDDGHYLVYETRFHRGDWCEAIVYVEREGGPLTLARVQHEFPELATAAGMPPVRRI